MLFEQATGTDTAKNLAEYFGAGEDTIYLSGMAAGAATKNGTIGYVVAVPDPRGDPPRERVRARRAGDASGREGQARVDELVVRSRRRRRRRPRASHAAGADVLGQNVDSPATGQFAESEGIPWVGYDSTRRSSRRSRGSPRRVYDWGPYYLQRVKAAMNGTWKPGFYYGSIKDGFTKLAPFGPERELRRRRPRSRRR